MTDANGDYYKGDWKYNKRHGRGIVISFDSKYDGEWKDDTFHGHGIKTYPNGSKYDGEWVNGQRPYNGTMVSW
jgi:hypothetical protein